MVICLKGTMENLIIAGTKKSPGIRFITNGDLHIKGSSFTEDAAGFYEPVIKWIDEFVSKASPEVTLTVELEYINTSSTTLVVKIFKKLKEKCDGHYKLNLIWKYDADDEDAFELGDMIQKVIKHPLLMVATKKE